MFVCQRLVGYVWVSKACRVCGCRTLVRFVWVSKACSVCGVEGLRVCIYFTL